MSIQVTTRGEGDAQDRALRVGWIALALVAATAAGAALETAIGVADASPVYLIAVVVAAAVFGTWAAIGTSLVSFLIYDFVFTSPRFSFEVADPAEWLSLLLFLLVAVVIGRLTSLLRERADEADRRSRESVALVAISHEIAMATNFGEAAAAVAERLRVDAEMSVVWITLVNGDSGAAGVDGDSGDSGDSGVDGDAGETLVAATDDPPDPAAQGVPWRLMRAEEDRPSDWLRVMETSPAAATGPATAPATGPATLVSYLVPIEGDAQPAGWIHAARNPDEPRPGRGARRILTLAADQLAFALRRDELRTELNVAEIARQGDALRAAILDSVSHELRTPIASIRAVAGGLLDPAVTAAPDDVIRAATAIDAEGARLADLVGSLLDMGRVQAGELHPDLQPYDLAEIIETAVRRIADPSPGHRLVVDIPESLPPVLVDARLFDVALGNVLDNAVRHTPAGTRIGLLAWAEDDGVVLAVDDNGPGLPPAAMAHLFDRFQRGPSSGEEPRRARQGLGLGLAIARGFVEGMGGSIEAIRNDQGGLGIRLRLRTAGDGPGPEAA